MQRLSWESCAHLTPAGLPLGISGMGLVIDGAVQQAPQPSRHFTRSSQSQCHRERSASKDERIGGLEHTPPHPVSQHPSLTEPRATATVPQFNPLATRRHCPAATKTQPQTARAVSTTSRSLSRCCSTAILFPCTVLLKPHCGLSASCSSGAYLEASSMRRFRSSGFSN
jgi:hypothetical protein